ncbi:MAG: hypothetical protein AAB900_01755, partial [Patescibacteria group bacterium]
MTKMIIANLVEKSKLWRQNLAQEAEPLFATLLVILLSLGGLGFYELYRLERQKPAIVITTVADQFRLISQPQSKSVSSQPGVQEGKVLASKNGQKFYYPWCSGVSRIKEVNRIYFASA